MGVVRVALLVTIPCELYLEVFSFSFGMLRFPFDDISVVGTTNMAAVGLETVYDNDCGLSGRCFSFLPGDLAGRHEVEEDKEFLGKTGVNKSIHGVLLGSNCMNLVLFDPVSDATHFLSMIDSFSSDIGDFSWLLSLSTEEFILSSFVAFSLFSTLFRLIESLAALLSFVACVDSISVDFSSLVVVVSVHSFSDVSTDGDCTMTLQSSSCVQLDDSVSAGLSSVSGLSSPFVIFFVFSVCFSVSSSVVLSSSPNVSVQVISCFAFLAGFVYTV